MTLIAQLLAILFSLGLAMHDLPAVLNFEYYGVTKKAMSNFHMFNNCIKFIFCIEAAFIVFPGIWSMAYVGLLSALWIYLVFDIFLNLDRPNRPWYYLGVNDKDGKRWIRWFGKKAGIYKACILFGIIIALNLLNYFYGFQSWRFHN